MPSSHFTARSSALALARARPLPSRGEAPAGPWPYRRYRDRYSLANSEGPAGRSQVGALDLAQSPLRRISLLSSQSAAFVIAAVIGRVFGFAQCVSADGGVPDGRDGTELELEARFGFENQIFEKWRMGFEEVRLIVFIAERLEGHDAVHHAGVDGAESVCVARAFEHPALGFANGFGADVLQPASFPDLDGAVDLMEDDAGCVSAPAREFFVGREQLVDADVVRRLFYSGESLNDGERNDDRARPGRHFIEDVAGREDDLRRDTGHVLFRVEAEAG